MSEPIGESKLSVYYKSWNFARRPADATNRPAAAKNLTNSGRPPVPLDVVATSP